MSNANYSCSHQNVFNSCESRLASNIRRVSGLIKKARADLIFDNIFCECNVQELPLYLYIFKRTGACRAPAIVGG